MTDEEYESADRDLKDELIRDLRPEILKVMVKALRTFGWRGDYGEAVAFVQWCHEVAGAEMPKEAEAPFLTP